MDKKIKEMTSTERTEALINNVASRGKLDKDKVKDKDKLK